MIYIVINSKGGVGKSTFSNQILAHYLYEKNKKQKTKLIEIDDENEDSKILKDSEILTSKLISTNKINTIDEIFLEDKDVVIDVGGNKTATIFLKELENIELDDNVTFCIPLGTGIQDVANAKDTQIAINKIQQNAKIIFVLSSNKGDDIEDDYVQFFGSKFIDTKFQINSDKYVVINYDSVLNNSKSFNKTYYDISNNKTDFWKLAKEAQKEQNTEDKDYYLFMNRFKKKAIIYREYIENDVFNRLDELLER